MFLGLGMRPLHSVPRTGNEVTTYSVNVYLEALTKVTVFP